LSQKVRLFVTWPTRSPVGHWGERGDMEEAEPAPDGFSSRWDAVQLAAIEYPLKFELAAKFMASHPSLSTSMSIEDQLMFYGLHQQATLGPCNIPRPHLWQRVERAKWDIWKELGNMSKVEAMFLYTRSVEEKCVHWAQWHAIAPDIAAAFGLKSWPRKSAPVPRSPPSRVHDYSSPAFDSPPQSLPPGNEYEYASPARAPSPPTHLSLSKVRSKVPEQTFELSQMPEINFSLPFDSLHPHPAAHTWGAECATEPAAEAPRVYTEIVRRGDEEKKEEELRVSTEMQAAADPAPVLSHALPFETSALDVFPPLSAASPDPTEHGASRKDKAVEEAEEKQALPFEMPALDVFPPLSAASPDPAEHGAIGEDGAEEEEKDLRLPAATWGAKCTFELSPMPRIDFTLPLDVSTPEAHKWGAECANATTEMKNEADLAAAEKATREAPAVALPAMEEAKETQALPFEMPALHVFPPLSAATPDPAEHGASSKHKAVEEATETPRHAMAFETPPTDVFSRAERGFGLELPRPMISTANWAQRWSLDIFSPISAASPLSAASALRFTSEPLRITSSPDPTEHEARSENKKSAALEEAAERGQGLIALAGGPAAKSSDIETPATALSTYNRQSTDTRGKGWKEGVRERGSDLDREPGRAKVRSEDAAVEVHKVSKVSVVYSGSIEYIN